MTSCEIYWDTTSSAVDFSSSFFTSYPLIINPLTLCSHLSPYNNSDRQLITSLIFKLWVSSLTELCWLHSKRVFFEHPSLLECNAGSLGKCKILHFSLASGIIHQPTQHHIPQDLNTPQEKKKITIEVLQSGCWSFKSSGMQCHVLETSEVKQSTLFLGCLQGPTIKHSMTQHHICEDCNAQPCLCESLKHHKIFSIHATLAAHNKCNTLWTCAVSYTYQYIYTHFLSWMSSFTAQEITLQSASVRFSPTDYLTWLLVLPLGSVGSQTQLSLRCNLMTMYWKTTFF